MPNFNVFTVNNFPMPATPPGYFVPNANGRAVPPGHTSWDVVINTTGLPGAPAAVLLAYIVVQYHYTGVQLGVTGLPNQGGVTNPDGSVTAIAGGTFTGWIDDAAGPMYTARLDRAGDVVQNGVLGFDLKRIIGAYPDTARALILSCPGYANVVQMTFDLT